MKKLLLLVGVVVIGVFSFVLMGNKTKDMDTDYLSILEEDSSSFYLRRANPDISFILENEDVRLFDSEGNLLETNFKKHKDGKVELLPPKNKYEEGQEYKIELGESNFFVDEDLGYADNLIVKIDKDFKESYTFTDNVKEIEDESFVVQDDILKLENDVEIGDIIINDASTIAYKIEGDMGDGEYKVSIPKIDEIYDELEVYGEYTLKLSAQDLEDIEIKTANQIKKSNWYMNLVKGVGADFTKSKVNVDFELKDSALAYKISILLDSDDGKSIWEKYGVKDHKLLIEFDFEMELSYLIDIENIKNWDIGFKEKLDFEKQILLIPKSEDGRSVSEIATDIYSNINSFVSSLTDLEDEIDIFDFVIDIIDTKVPITTVPGLFLHFELGPGVKFEGVVDLSTNVGFGIHMNQGLKIKDGKFSPYGRIKSNDNTFSAKIEGVLESRIGLFTELTLDVINENIAHIGFDNGTGIGVNGHTSDKIEIKKGNKSNKENDVYVLMNVFSKSNVIGKINYLFDTYAIDKNIFSYEKAVLELGDKDKFSTLKIDKSKPYLEYNPIMDEVKYSDIYGHSNFVYHVFPKGLEKKDDPYLSESLFLNIDSPDANKLQMDYNKRLNEGLIENKKEDNFWSFSVVLDEYETSDKLSFSWLHAGFRNNSGFIPQEHNLVTFDLSTGKMLRLKDIVDEKMADLIALEVLRAGEKIVEDSQGVIDFPNDVVYVDKIFEDETIDYNKKITYVYIPKEYGFMVVEDKLVVKINVEASTYGDPNQITNQETILEIPLT